MALELSNNTVSNQTIASILDIGKTMINKEVELLEGVEQVLQQLSKKYKSKGLEIIGLSSDFNEQSWQEAITKDSISIWNQAYMGKQAAVISAEYNIKDIPSYILIDKNGIIIEKYMVTDNHSLSFDDLVAKLKLIL